MSPIYLTQQCSIEKEIDEFGFLCRVLDIMKRDAAKDPATDPNAKRARLLINQVPCCSINLLFGALVPMVF